MQYEQNYTFESLGFKGVKPMILPDKPKGNTHYNTIIMPARDNAVVQYFIEQIYLYGKRTNKTNFFGCFVAGIAYMMDGSVILAFNGIGHDENSIGSLYAEPEYYKRAPIPPGIIVKSNFDYMAGFIGSRRPEALAILQEIPCNDRNKYHFRIVHESANDNVYDNIIKFPGV